MKISKIDFPYNGISVVSKEQFEAHKKLYDGYVNKTNEITDLLANNAGRLEANSIYSKYRGLKQGETFAIDGVILHELYFENIGNNNSQPGNLTKKLIENGFLNFKNWEKDFIACAKASRGWSILIYEQRTQSLRNISLDSHNLGNIVYMIPFIVLDMYEHAYFLDYQDNKVKYIENFLKDINWNIVEERIKNII